MKTLSLMIGLSLLVWGCGTDRPEARSAAETAAVSQPDNTGVNARDAGGRTVTSFDQSNDRADIDLVAEIRSQVLDIDDLSVAGQNIKIITNQRKVMLRGPVNSAAERDAIVGVATGIAGAANVTNELEVTPST